MAQLSSLLSLLVFLAPAQGQVQAPQANLRVVWRDARTQKELFSSADVLAYDPQNSLLLISSQKTRALAEWSQKGGQDMEVVDGKGLITKAHFAPPTLRMVTFGDSAPIYEAGVPLWINPYGSGLFRAISQLKGDVPDSADNRLAEKRLKSDLKQLVPIGELSRTSSPTRRWYKADEGISVWPSLSERSLRVGEVAYGTLFFSSDLEKLAGVAPAFDQVTMEVNLTANNGQFVSRTLVGPVAVSRQERQHIVPLRFNPWVGLEGSKLPTEEGGAEIGVSLLFQKRSPNGVTTVSRVSFPAQRTHVYLAVVK